MQNWRSRIEHSSSPRYLAIADCIAQDIKDRVLLPGDRLPPQRKLADLLDVDFTTVSRGYSEALKRKLVETHVGRGTFVLAQQAVTNISDDRRANAFDLTMNAPPEPTDPELLDRMRAGLSAVSDDLIHLLRYQSPAGSEQDKEAASIWLSMRGMVPSLNRIMVTPGAHATMLALLSVLAERGDTILCENVTYTGFRRIAKQLGLKLVGVPWDKDGIQPDALADLIKEHQPKALYLNPTLHNPTTHTIPQSRRLEIARLIQHENLPLIEDDAYGFIPPDAPPPLATSAPEQTWHIGGLAKCIGAGLRLAYTVAPDARSAFALENALRAVAVMASPLSMALTTRWVLDGTADQIRRFIRSETAARQEIAAGILTETQYTAQDNAFNVWLELPPGVTCAALMSQMSNYEIGIVPGDNFAVGSDQSNLARVCLGGRISRDRLSETLTHMDNQLWQLAATAGG